jgi:hypothetical protein
MSHFAVLVAASDEANLEAKLLPFHEYECTGIEQYTEFVVEHPADRAEEDAKAIIASLADNPKLKAKYEGYLVAGNFAELFNDWDGTVPDTSLNFGRRTNPNAKWDWWTIGGRFADFRGIKSRAKAKSIKWATIRQNLRDNQLQRHDTYHAALEQHAAVTASDSIKDSYDKLIAKSDEWQKVFPTVSAYAVHQAAIKEANMFTHGYSIDNILELQQDREQFAANLDDTPVWAFIDAEGKWQEKGDMGWWGFSSKDESHNGYAQRFWAWVEALDPNTLIYLVDCHI